MRSMSICTATALAVLWGGSATLAKEAKPTTPAQKPAAEAKEAKRLTPQQRRIESLQKNHETELEPWRIVLKIAEQEKATMTIAAIKQVISSKEETFKKSLAQAEKPVASQESLAARARANTANAAKDVNKPAQKKPAEKK